LLFVLCELQRFSDGIIVCGKKMAFHIPKPLQNVSPFPSIAVGCGLETVDLVDITHRPLNFVTSVAILGSGIRFLP
jgi:hypothetical protein